MEARERFESLVRGPERAARLDEAALCIGACGEPGVSVDDGLARLDELAGSVVDPTLDGLRASLFASGAFRGNADDYYDPANSFLHRVLERGLGIPITLSVVAIEVGRRVGVELVGIGLPGHFVVRLATDDERFVDCFRGGAVLTADEAAAVAAAAAGGAVHPAAFAPVGPLAIVARMLANLKAIYAQRRDLAGLQWVMALRTAIPGLDERQEFARLMAPLN
jgi:regulator of sirC expression with transglutaminase-like and TPR domain